MYRTLIAAAAALMTATLPALAGTCTQPGDTGRVTEGYFVPKDGDNGPMKLFDRHTAENASIFIAETTGYMTRPLAVASRQTGDIVGYFPLTQAEQCLASTVSTKDQTSVPTS